jgi:hypothetical protein
MHVGSYCYVPSWSVLKDNTTRDPKRAMLIHNGEPLGKQRPGSPYPGHWIRRTGCEIPFAHADRRVEEWRCGSSPWLVLFQLVGPPLQPVEVGFFPGTVIPSFYAKTKYSSYAWPRINCFTHMAKSVYRYPNVTNKEFYYYINSVSKDYEDSQPNRTVEDSITPQERQPG